MKSRAKKKAFTLTELLVVVIVIGILAAVVLPKFNKVIETRKTTEAEEMMAAVRTEQEKRCALDKNYLTDIVDLKDTIASANSKNFSYKLTSTGIEAQSKGNYGYTLKMPSYADGRLCCESAEQCLKLNKDYPLCSDLTGRADYQDGAECAGEGGGKECSGAASRACGCGGKGVQYRTCDTSTGTWSDWGTCSVSDSCDCVVISGPQPANRVEPCNECGEIQVTYSCDSTTGSWVEQRSECSVSDPSECTGCPAGKVKDPDGNCVCEYVDGIYNSFQIDFGIPSEICTTKTKSCNEGRLELPTTFDEANCTCIEPECPKYDFFCETRSVPVAVCVEHMDPWDDISYAFEQCMQGNFSPYSDQWFGPGGSASAGWDPSLGKLGGKDLNGNQIIIGNTNGTEGVTVPGTSCVACSCIPL